MLYISKLFMCVKQKCNFMFKNMILWGFLSILIRVSHDFGWFFCYPDTDPHHYSLIQIRIPEAKMMRIRLDLDQHHWYNVRYCTHIHCTSHFSQVTIKTRPCLTGHSVLIGLRSARGSTLPRPVILLFSRYNLTR